VKKQRVIIQGAHKFAKVLKMRIDCIFEVIAFIDRKKNIKETMFDGIPILKDYDHFKDFEFDYVFVTARDICGIQRELYQSYSIPYEKIISMQSTHQIEKQVTFAAIANEIAFRNVIGSIAEVGLDYGDTAKHLNLFFPGRTLYLFDTFSGFDKRDVEYDKQTQMMSENDELFFDNYNDRSNAQEVLNKMYFKENCVVKVGWFPESLEKLDDTFAFVHIDCDLQKPIQAALDYFYPRLSNGGVICVHDYFNPRFTGIRQVVRNFASKNNILYVPIALYSGVAICK
jgi:O-methyltransferase